MPGTACPMNIEIMKKREQVIPHNYRTLRCENIGAGGSQSWIFTCYLPGPDFGAPANRRGQSRLRRLIREQYKESFVCQLAADEYVDLKQRELDKIYAERGPVIDGVFDPTLRANPPGERLQGMQKDDRLPGKNQLQTLFPVEC